MLFTQITILKWGKKICFRFWHDFYQKSRNSWSKITLQWWMKCCRFLVCSQVGKYDNICADFTLILPKFRKKFKKATTFDMTTFYPPLYLKIFDQKLCNFKVSQIKIAKIVFFQNFIIFWWENIEKKTSQN